MTDLIETSESDLQTGERKKFSDPSPSLTEDYAEGKRLDKPYDQVSEKNY